MLAGESIIFGGFVVEISKMVVKMSLSLALDTGWILKVDI